MSPKRCTCGPHPRIDLTDAYLEYNRRVGHRRCPGDDGNASDNNFHDVSEQVSKACSSHGCFQVIIRLPVSSDDVIGSSIAAMSLAKSRNKIEREIESLFSAPFLRDALSSEQEGVSSTKPSNWEALCNGKTMEAKFIDSNGCMQSGTFRGRSAESGDEENAKPEPKLSWEFQRCCLSSEPLKCSTKSCNQIVKSYEQWKLLPMWTGALHSVASTVIHLLGISPGVVLQEESCSCAQQPNCMPPNEKHKCNIDLLRVFRYDALDSNDATLGSSEHSDWGTLTVVWQDEKGGLQSYCEACDKWSDVDASVSYSNDTNSSERIINLIVHVGDFLSLASIQSDNSVAWHSPRHRVLCPIISHNEYMSNSSSESNFNSQCRRSLVYFAYPPPGVSLKDAQKVIRPLVPSQVHEDSKFDSSSQDNLKMLSVLHDQSAQNTLSTPYNLDSNDRDQSLEPKAMISYNKMLDVPFDKVIAEKWAQVQRN